MSLLFALLAAFGIAALTPWHVVGGGPVRADTGVGGPGIVGAQPFDTAGGGPGRMEPADTAIGGPGIIGGSDDTVGGGPG